MGILCHMHRKLFRKSQWTHCVTPAREAMRLHGLTYSSLAARLRKDGLAVSVHQIVRIVRGDARLPELRAAVARTLGFPVERLWPERRVA